MKRFIPAAAIAVFVFAVAVFAIGAETVLPVGESAPSEPEDRLMIGMSKVDITPDVAARRVTLSGYAGRRGKPATGVLDPVFARALVGTGEGGALFGIVSMDICYITSEFRGRVLTRVKEHGFTDANLLIAATHTHASIHQDRTPLARLLFGAYDAELFEATVGKVADALVSAKESMRPGKWEIAVRRVPHMNRSRLDPAFEIDEHQMAMAQEPDPEKYPVNETLTVIRVTADDGDPIGAVVHFAAHPTILSPKNLQISADYPGVLCKRLEEEMGEGSVALFLNATLGDTAPTPDWEDDVETEVRQVREYGNQLADKAVAALADLKPMGDPVIVGSTHHAEVNNVQLRALFGWKLPESVSRLFILSPDLPFQALRLGDLALVAIPGEPTTQVGEVLKKLVPEGLSPRIVAPANGYIGYVVTPEEYAGGTYAADSCFLGPGALGLMKESVAAAMAGLE